MTTPREPTTTEVLATLRQRQDRVAEWIAEFNEGTRRARDAERLTDIEATQEKRARHVTDDMRDQMRTLRADGYTLQQIAEVVGVAHSTVHQWTKDVPR